MKNYSKQLTIITFCVIFITGLRFTPFVLAEEITVAGNGSTSQTAVNVTTNQQTDVAQSNTAAVTNTVTSNATTGDNTAKNNIGNTTIKTGDSTAATTVTTQANQSTTTLAPCCQSDSTTVQVIDNGAQTKNSIIGSNQSNTAVVITQNATIQNSVTHNLATGNNTASNTSGNVIIKTGNITSHNTISNGPINVARVSVPTNTNDNLFKLKIFGNGFGSVNEITVDQNYQNTILTNNTANIINTLIERFETGHNTADHNNGNVAIITGDSISTVAVINKPINASEVDVNCNCTPKEKQQTPTAPIGGNIPTSTTSSSNNNTGTSSSGGTSTNVSTGSSLPVTGNNWLVLALFGNIMMLLLGAYLRLRSGRSPTLLNIS